MIPYERDGKETRAIRCLLHIADVGASVAAACLFAVGPIGPRSVGGLAVTAEQFPQRSGNNRSTQRFATAASKRAETQCCCGGQNISNLFASCTCERRGAHEYLSPYLRTPLVYTQSRGYPSDLAQGCGAG